MRNVVDSSYSAELGLDATQSVEHLSNVRGIYDGLQVKPRMERVAGMFQLRNDFAYRHVLEKLEYHACVDCPHLFLPVLASRARGAIIG